MTQPMIQSKTTKIKNNLAREVTVLRENLTSFVRVRQTPASHLLVVMISAEDRKINLMLYQFNVLLMKVWKMLRYEILPTELYKKCIREEWRLLVCNVCTCVHITCTSQLQVISLPHMYLLTGFTINGEWNSLRVHGNTRPLSIFSLWSMAKSKYSRLWYKTMIDPLRWGSVMFSCSVISECEISWWKYYSFGC